MVGRGPDCAGVHQRGDGELPGGTGPAQGFSLRLCELEPGAWVTGAELRKVYERHCEESGVRYPLGPHAFGERLRSRGAHRTLRKIEGRPVRIWEGIRIVQ